MMKSEIPILDCSLISGSLEHISNAEGFKEFMKQLGNGMSDIGFVYLVNHGVSSSVLDNVAAESRKFFELELETKMKYRKIDAVENFNGYTPAEDEIVSETNKEHKEYKEAWDYWGPDLLNGDDGSPVEVPGLKPAIYDMRSSLIKLSKKLFLCFGHYLKLEDPDFFLKRHRALEDPDIFSHTVIRTNYYMALDPKEEFPEDTMRLTEHNDWGTLTFLVQDSVGGLEAKKTDGTWIPVPPVQDSIVLNAGLMLEMWSGGHFPATTHRVRLLKDKLTAIRQSYGFFIQPDGDSNCLPLVEEKKEWKPMYPKMEKDENHFEYFRERVRGSRAY